MAQLQSDINSKVNGNTVKILGAGFEVRSPRTVSQLLGPVTGLTIALGANTGEVTIRFKGIKGTKLYVIEGTNKLMPGNNWQQVAETTKSKVTVKNLNSGEVNYFRIMCINAAGVGPASETISIMVY